MRFSIIQSSKAATGFPTRGYDIVFDHVGFAYNTGETVLKDVSFTAKQGEVTALVGPSGGGKNNRIPAGSKVLGY